MWHRWATCGIILRMSNNNDLYATFAELDQDGDGRITAAEFQQAMLERGETVTSDEVVSIFRNADTDHDGKIDFMEFTAAWNA